MAKTRTQKRAQTGPAERVVQVLDMGSGDLVEAAAAQARVARERLDVLTGRTVQLGRSEGWSWDRLGLLLGVPGETLRRHYSAEVK